MVYLQLFISFLQIGLFSFGGGYAALPLIQEQVVTLHKWLELSEFANLVTISQMTPGPIAINTATFVGLQVGGIFGAIIATVGCVLPASIIVSVLAFFYIKYKNVAWIQNVLSTLRPAVVAMIATAGISILTTALWGTAAVSIGTMRIDMIVIFAIAFIVLSKFKANPITVMLLCGVAKVVLFYVTAL
ncbi:chromate transporter [Anaerorhabdus sp.]|uniref:chromate transporter n=1 Tax=Anaerorhabdus sp. TaxID=1872524 RepID=UPI002FCC927D